MLDAVCAICGVCFVQAMHLACGDFASRAIEEFSGGPDHCSNQHHAPRPQTAEQTSILARLPVQQPSKILRYWDVARLSCDIGELGGRESKHDSQHNEGKRVFLDCTDYAHFVERPKPFSLPLQDFIPLLEIDVADISRAEGKQQE